MSGSDAAEFRIASTVANGCNIWHGLHHGPTGLLETPGGCAAGDMLRELAEHEDCYTSTESAANVAMLYSYDTERMYKATVDATDLYEKGGMARDFKGDFSHSTQGMCDDFQSSWSRELSFSGGRLRRGYASFQQGGA
ncbi:MAG: hypothetical protein KAG97_09315 [Victivallales bacterium]|nr:hypothetical protein [Victivallales bacterium]